MDQETPSGSSSECFQVFCYICSYFYLLSCCFHVKWYIHCSCEPGEVGRKKQTLWGNMPALVSIGCSCSFICCIQNVYALWWIFNLVVSITHFISPAQCTSHLGVSVSCTEYYFAVSEGRLSLVHSNSTCHCGIWTQLNPPVKGWQFC